MFWSSLFSAEKLRVTKDGMDQRNTQGSLGKTGDHQSLQWNHLSDCVTFSSLVAKYRSRKSEQ
jgi:hypothetical protein